MKLKSIMTTLISCIVITRFCLAQEKLPPPPVLPNLPDTSIQKRLDVVPDNFPPAFPRVEPRGRGDINLDFLTSHPPGMLVLPQYAGPASEIDEKTAIQVATERAKWEWGETVRFGTVTPLIGADGRLCAYDVDFTIDGSSFGDYVKVASDWQEFCRTRMLNQELPRANKKDEPTITRELGSSTYGSVTVSATYDTPPIRSCRAGVSNFYASGWVAFKIAQDVMHTDRPILNAIFFYGSWERAYEFKSGTRTVVIEGQEPWSWYDGLDFRSISNNALQQRKEYIFKLIKESGLDSSSVVDSIRDSNQKELRKWLEQKVPNQTPKSNHYILGYNSTFKPFRWFGGCAPTSGSMVMNYYDEDDWFGRLNYWYQRADEPVYGGEICHVATTSISMPSFMGTDANGSTAPSNIYPGMVNYANSSGCGYCFSGGTNSTCYVLDWCWDEIVSEINGNYPFAWTLDWYPNAGGRHTVAAVGYEDANKDVWCYNTWLTGGVPEKAHYSGGVIDFSFVASPHPGCWVYYDAKLTSLDGYQTYGSCGNSGSVTGGQPATITWNNYNVPGHHVNIYYSTDGGVNWTGIVNTADDGSYTWSVPCGISSTKARILLQQFSTASTFVSSDDSYGDFQIIQGSPPPSPSTCTASDNNCNYIAVSWQNVSGEDGYKVFRDGSQIGTTSTDQTSYQDNVVGTHSYKIIAYNSCGESPYSPSDNGTGLTIPTSPGSCSASDNNCNYITISWQNVSGEDGYKVFRDGSQIGTTSTDQTSYQDNVTGTHSYKVKSYNVCGESGYSPSDNGTGLTTPSAPATCTASDNNCNYIAVSWQNVTGEDGYKVYRDNSQIGTTGADQILYQDNIIGTHSYKVKAYHNTCGESGYSPSDNGTGLAIPSAPGSCTASDNNCNYVTISWQNVSGEDGYQIYRDNSQIGIAGIDQTSYQDNITGTHSYKVTAYNTCGESGYSPSDNGTGLTAPSAPSTCTASDNNCNYVMVSWQNVSGEDGYKVFRDGSQVGTTPADQTSYQDNTTGTHSYKVRAYHNTCGDSGDSPSDNGTSKSTPNDPTSAPACSSGQISGNIYIDIWWSTVSGATSYCVYRDDIQQTCSITGTSWRDNSPGTLQRCYRISARNECGESNQSNLTCCTPSDVNDIHSNEGIPSNFAIYQNYPNPFNPETEIEFALPISCHVRLVIYNMLGIKVITLVDQFMASGYKRISWNGKDDVGNDISSGIYFYRLEAGYFFETHKMVLLK